MYRYDEVDHDFVRERAVSFRDQVERRLAGSLTEDEFRPLRLQNGVYLELHAYMLRVAIPYGTLNSAQFRQLAFISEKWDRGFGHFTTRQNIQFNWLKLNDVPDVLDALAEVGMHAIQTSGNCIRSVTADHFAGAAADEVGDPRPVAELVRQWACAHPEFGFLPRKLKIAVTGSASDRAAIRFHDIGLRLKRSETGEPGFEIIVGGGLGRTPMIGKVLRNFLPRAELLSYLEAVLRVYNLSGRRDNKYKARIKILIHDEGLEKMKAKVEEEHARQLASEVELYPVDDELTRIERYFSSPAFDTIEAGRADARLSWLSDPEFEGWASANTAPHKQQGYAIATIPMKSADGAPGDVSADNMRLIADIAERYSLDELRLSHEQNVVLPHVRKGDLPALYRELRLAGLEGGRSGLVTDIVACPGMDYCSLATARSLPLAKELAHNFADLGLAHLIGELKIKISGCVNACGHHHMGHIGILGLEKAGVESYQLVLGGDPVQDTAAIGQRVGPGFSAQEVVPAVEQVVNTYLGLRNNNHETFIETYRRTGSEPFRAALYMQDKKAA